MLIRNCAFWALALLAGIPSLALGQAGERSAAAQSVVVTKAQQVAPMEPLPPIQGLSSTKGPFYYLSENELRARKLARGVANIGLCVAEIPNQAFQEAYATSPVTGVFVGAAKGVWKGFKRLAIGCWEVVTFYHPGSNHYQPFIEPEVVFMEYLH